MTTENIKALHAKIAALESLLSTYVMDTARLEQNVWEPIFTKDELPGIIARGYCAEANKHKEMDSDLVQAIADEVFAAQPATAAPVMPPSKGQSSVLFEDGYAEGWAKCQSAYHAAGVVSPEPVLSDVDIGRAIDLLRIPHWDKSNQRMREAFAFLYRRVSLCRIGEHY